MAGGVKETFEDKIRKFCKESRVPFPIAARAVCEAYGFADWAVVAKAVDSHKMSFWEAGSGENSIGDRDRAMLLVGEMEDLKDVIIQYFRKRQA